MKRILGTLFLVLLALPTWAEDKEPIKIGDISSYTAGNIFAEPTRNGFTIAAEKINASGGILGRPVEVISKDDLGKPDEAIKVVERLIYQDDVKILTGCNLANIELAISDYARHNGILYVSSCTNSDKFFWGNGHSHAFRGGGATVYTINHILAKRAAEQGKKRWVAVNHSYDWGQSNFNAFKEALHKYQPDAQWVEVQWPAVGKIQAGAVVQALKAEKPDALYTSLWGSDLFQLLREGKKRGLLTDDLLKVSQDLGRQESQNVLGTEMPEGWLTVGLPAAEIDNPMMKEFVAAYREKFGTDKMGWTGVTAYQTLFTIKAAIEKAGDVDTDAIIGALEDNFSVNSVYGVPFRIRSSDHAPSHGVWVGTSAVVNDAAAFVDTEYVDGWDYLPSEKE